MANLDITDAELAERLHTSRQTINSRRKGRVAMTAEDLGELAQVLDVDVRLFFGSPHQAVQWLVENRPEALNEEPVLSKHFVPNGCTYDRSSRLIVGLPAAKMPQLLTRRHPERHRVSSNPHASRAARMERLTARHATASAE